MIKPLHGRLSLSPALVLTIALASGCGRVTKVYTTAGDVCDSLDVVFESAQGKLAETEWRAIISGDLSGLKQQRAEWSEYLVKSAYLDSLRQLERMVSDTVLLNRLSLIRRRILSELAANDPSVSMVMDSLSYRRLKSGITAPPPPDSLPEDSLPSAEKRLGMYRTYFESGASLKDWPARLTRLRNRQRRSVGYNSALDLNLELVGITRDRVEELVRKVDSVSRGPYRRLLDTLKSQFSIRNLGAEDLLYYREYMTPGRENRGLKVSRRRTLRACRQALEKLGLPIENRPLYIDTQSVSAKLTAPQLVCAHPPDDVRLLGNLDVVRVNR
ncbi:MAG: hypothetical protein ACE5GA_11815, partial [Candidatus Zixiibacteriota bacterium]